MRVLLTGAGGFLGRHLARSLLAEDVAVLKLHFRHSAPEDFVTQLKQAHPDARIEVVLGNLLYAPDATGLVADVDCVVHAAAGMRGSPADMFANTVVGTRNLLDAAGAAGVGRIVLVSSFSVYRTEPLADTAMHDESVAVETVGIDKGPYAYAKTRQEHLLEEYRERFGFQTVVLRPGVIYGPGGGALSSRVGIRALGLFFNLGRKATLPLTYVENCADAIARAAVAGVDGHAYNVVDDELPSCSTYLRGYRDNVERLRVFPVPYWLFLLGSRLLVRYNKASRGQLPAVFTPYVVRSMYRDFRYPNAALKRLGWQPRVTTGDGLQRTFDYFSQRMD
ncbi:NAD-dependent epimerase/dehydratase family protein [Novilysobacter antarcticus]|uniref:NAD-dependent epimerase/dehydratase family protein n=1 Tax=Novilysobacter antarcticus TaxID=2862543 RepID=UPI001C9A2314|nr:NAD(P)-dependent oxidoreductase [Lysobacter antarcticus]